MANSSAGSGIDESLEPWRQHTYCTSRHCDLDCFCIDDSSANHCDLVESYFVISSGVILMGFGGSQWTNQFAINIIRYAVSVGAKLFMVQLVIGLRSVDFAGLGHANAGW